MVKWPRKTPLRHAIAFLLGVAGVLLYTTRPALPGAAQDLRTLQVWPDRNLGVASGLWESPTAALATQVFPIGVSHTASGEVAQARTYLHFPLDVFPPGAEILRATLYVYVDSSSSIGEATLGAYRVLEPWAEKDWSDEPATWPALLTSPVAVTTVRFGAAAPPPPSPTPGPMPSPSPSPPAGPRATPTAVTPPPPPTLPPTDTPARPSTPTPTPTPPTSPWPTPPTSPLSAPPLSQRSTSARRARLASFQSPPPTPAASSPPRPTAPPLAPGATLRPVAGIWLTWDVTALVRAWQAGEVTDDGLGLAPAPEPDADPETAGDLIVARQYATDDPKTQPYLIVELEVRPVTPAPVLPPAGRRSGWGTVGLLLIGTAVLLLGLILGRK